MDLSEERPSPGLIGNAVLTLDRAVRRRVGIYEYCTHDRCIFRVHRDHAEHSILLKDGTFIRAGDPILKLHLWNEHMPFMGSRGPSVAWGRQLGRAMDLSLAELARYLREHREVRQVKAICADMCLGTSAKQRQLSRIVGRFGFETARPGLGQPRPLERLSQNIMMFLLVSVTNPSTLRVAILLRTHQRIFLSCEALLQRYAAPQLPPHEEAQHDVPELTYEHVPKWRATPASRANKPALRPLP